MRRTEPSPRTVIATMRQIKRDQCTMSHMNQEACKFIFDAGLMKLTLWPAWVISYTQDGLDYLQENSEGDE